MLITAYLECFPSLWAPPSLLVALIICICSWNPAFLSSKQCLRLEPPSVALTSKFSNTIIPVSKTMFAAIAFEANQMRLTFGLFVLGADVIIQEVRVQIEPAPFPRFVLAALLVQIALLEDRLRIHVVIGGEL